VKDVDYSKAPPAAYACSVCGAKGIKLWREYQVPVPSIFCALCAAYRQGVSIIGLDDAGYHYTDSGERVDMIGRLVPAIPDEEDIGYWGYSSNEIPAVAVDWWRRLPSYGGDQC
jgi:hypothetical protein